MASTVGGTPVAVEINFGGVPRKSGSRAPTIRYYDVHSYLTAR